MEQQLKEEKGKKDTSVYWRTWSKAITNTFCEYLSLGGPAKAKAKQHGRMITAKVKTGMTIDAEGNARTRNTNQYSTAHRLCVKQLNRIQLTTRTQNIGNWKLAGKERHMKHIDDTVCAFCRTASINEDMEQQHDAEYLQDNVVWIMTPSSNSKASKRG